MPFKNVIQCPGHSGLQSLEYEEKDNCTREYNNASLALLLAWACGMQP